MGGGGVSSPSTPVPLFFLSCFPSPSSLVLFLSLFPIITARQQLARALYIVTIVNSKSVCPSVCLSHAGTVHCKITHATITPSSLEISSINVQFFMVKVITNVRREHRERAGRIKQGYRKICNFQSTQSLSNASLRSRPIMIKFM